MKHDNVHVEEKCTLYWMTPYYGKKTCSALLVELFLHSPLFVIYLTLNVPQIITKDLFLHMLRYNVQFDITYILNIEVHLYVYLNISGTEYCKMIFMTNNEVLKYVSKYPEIPSVCKNIWDQHISECKPRIFLNCGFHQLIRERSPAQNFLLTIPEILKYFSEYPELTTDQEN